MLTRMDEDGMSYEDALKEAQERGFAEADPTADVDGLDAAPRLPSWLPLRSIPV